MAMLEELRNQLQESLSDPEFVFTCCGVKFGALYEFRQHVFQHHRDIYDGVFAGFHREVPFRQFRLAVLKGKGRVISVRLRERKPHCPHIRLTALLFLFLWVVQ